MHKTVYPDLFLLMNFLMDYLILRTEGRLLRRRPRKYGLFLGACIGSVGICFPVFGSFSLPVKQIFIVLLMIFVQLASFPEKGVTRLAAGVLTFLLTGFLISGLLSFLFEHTFAGGWLAYLRAGGGGRTASVLAAAGSVLLGVLCAASVRVLMEAAGSGRGRAEGRLVPVTLFWKDRAWQVTGLMDTGNTLRCPGNGRPVHILEKSAAGALLGVPAARIRWISYRSLGKKDGVLPAVVIDGMQIGAHCYLSRPVVAVSRMPVSEDGSYQMILSEEECRRGTRTSPKQCPGRGDGR